MYAAAAAATSVRASRFNFPIPAVRALLGSSELGKVQHITAQFKRKGELVGTGPYLYIESARTTGTSAKEVTLLEEM